MIITITEPAINVAIDGAIAHPIIISSDTVIGPKGDTGPPSTVPGPPGPGIATGGTSGQVLKKNSTADYDTTWSGLNKSDVGLGSVDNTSDSAKPVSSAQQTALNTKVDKVGGKGLSTEDYTTTEKTKLSGIATGATANDTDTNLKARANHTGTQTASTISDFSTAADGRIAAQKAVANGLATLDATAKIPTSQLPDAILGSANYQGVWNASTNVSPTLVSGVGNKGYYWVVAVAGSTNIDGESDWKIGDWIIFNGSKWQKVDNTDAVNSVNGKQGAVVIDKTDVGLSSVDNTSDANKPVSTAQATAIAAKLSLSGGTMTGAVILPNGTAAAPALVWGSGAGIWYDAANACISFAGSPATSLQAATASIMASSAGNTSFLINANGTGNVSRLGFGTMNAGTFTAGYQIENTGTVFQIYLSGVATPLVFGGSGNINLAQGSAYCNYATKAFGVAGQTSPIFPLHLPATTGNKICLFGSATDAYFGLSIAAATQQYHVNSLGGNHAFGYFASSAFTGTSLIKGNGTASFKGTILGIRTVTGPTTLVETDQTVLFNLSANGNQALPAAATNTGLILVLKKIDATASVLTLTTAIDGTANKTLSSQWQKIKVQSDGSNWYEVQ